MVSRQAAPTGTSAYGSSTETKRRQETMKAACVIHGGSSSNTTPATIGMVETVETGSKEEDIVKAVRKTRKLKGKVLPKLYKEDLGKFESSNENMLRSIACYYSNGVMGRAKYRSVYKATSYRNVSKMKRAVRIKVANCPSPRLVPYHRLMLYIKSIEIGKLYDVREMLCDGLEESEKVNGCYRELGVFLKLAEFYLNSNKYNILTFNEPNTFHIALGGDGAPFGKDDTACSWLVSFLNIGHHILSRNENFLLFGANCSENSLPVTRFIAKLMTDIHHIQNNSYSLSCKGEPVSVKFAIAELPNDMKMLAFLAGELTNSATYFSTFADVSKDNIVHCRGTFGPNPTDTLKPWPYKNRLKVAEAASKFRKKLNPNVTSKTNRNKVTTFIANQKSRQEFIPLVGDLISKAHIEPLHLKNNACALAHRFLLKIAISWSNLSTCISNFSQVPPQSLFFKYVDSLKSQCGLNRLAKRIIRWFNGTGANGKDFDYRFTGKDSRMFLHNFMFLIGILESQSKSQQAKKVTHIHAYLCLCLHNAVSLFSRVNISGEEVSELKTHCRNFYRGYCLYLNVNPTVWSLGNVVPVHTEEMKMIYGLGLGLNSMEGRESKHIAIAKYCANTAFLYRWKQVFRHEYISLIWLRQQGYNAKVNTKTTSSYVPKRVYTNNPEFCNCGFNKSASDNLCRFCSHKLRTKIRESIEKCELVEV